MSDGRSTDRLDSIDLLRGVVIVLMALDHARDFFSPFPYSPEDLSQASAALFWTRWVTHVCAPVFVLLAGLGAGLSALRRGSTEGLSAFLLSRGLWLIVLELTLSNLAWLSYFQGYGFVQVLWVLGWSMIMLAGLIHLPRPLLLIGSLLLIVGHHLLDGIAAREMAAPWSYLWGLLHEQMWIPMGGSFGFSVIYPLLPWPAVMALGYWMAPVLARSEADRRRQLTQWGLALTGAFVVLRLINVYGDPSPWQANERGPLFTVLSVLNTTKYPPSLLFLLMTLGPALILLPWLERWRGRAAEALLTFGRVPLFFYLPHFYLLHAMAALYSQLRYGAIEWWIRSPQSWPEAYVPDLGLTYLAWIVAVLLMLPACRWFAGVKSRRRDWWLRYL